MSAAPLSATLLIELLTEELPPKALKRLSVAFAETLVAQLRAQGFLSENTGDKGTGTSAAVTIYATPRRLAVRIDGVPACAADKPFTQKVLPISVAFDAEGKPTTPLLRKLEALGLTTADLPKLKRAPDGKAEALFFEGVTPGQTLAAGVQTALDAAIAQLPIPKVMRYPTPGGYYNEISFVRPAHRLLVLHGKDVLPVTALGLKADRVTQGHRFLAQASTITVDDVAHYENLLLTQGKVIASFDARRAKIVEALDAAAAKVGAKVVAPDALLDEVTSLVEWPVVYQGGFDSAFLKVPQECLILTMQQNQKYFALTDNNGKLVERFLLVSNLLTDKPAAIVSGNERVLRARLADARFFFEQDCKKPLASRVDALDSVVYFKGLGSQRARVARVEIIAGKLAAALGANVDNTQTIARLAKADLVTDMVGEFPELQGIMGRYYALHDGTSTQVAQGIEQHYWPKFAGDRLPESTEALCVAMADKLEAIVGMFVANHEPTGDKDPFGLRRAAIGVLRMVIEKRLSIGIAQLVTLAGEAFDPALREAVGKNKDGVVPEWSAVQTKIEDFFYDRLRGLMKEEGHATQAIEAVLTQRPQALALVPDRLQAVRAFASLPEAETLAAANKRIVNILKKNADGTTHAAVQPALLQDDAEKALYEVFHRKLTPQVDTAMQQHDFTKALQVLASARSEVDRFFEEVMVMAEDPQVRTNRLALLSELQKTMNQVANIAMLAS